MNAMFYSLKETAEKLNKTEEEIKEIVKQGRLREFREGPNSLFKADEVEALMSDISIMTPTESAAPSGQKPDEDEISLTPEPSEISEPTDIPEPVMTPEPSEIPEPTEIPEPVMTPEPTVTQEPIETPEPTETPEPIEIPELMETPELAITPEPTETPEPVTTPEPTETPEPVMTPEPTETPEPVETPEPAEIPELIDTSEPSMVQEPFDTAEPAPTPEPTEIPELIDTSEPAMMQEPFDTAEPTPTPEPTEIPELIDTSEPSLMQEPFDTADSVLKPETTETSAMESELTGADTAIAGEGTGALDEMDTGLQATDDTVIEAKDTTTETPLQEIEEDVNLDSFGSGSGLLDLSLQADDTSLGGILDEIYAPEAGEDQQVGETTGSAVEMAAEAAQMLPEGALTAAGPARMVSAIGQAYVEPEPDTISNALGIMLFLPLLAIIYTAIVAVTGFGDIMPSIREMIQGIIWYVAGGAVVVAILIVGAAFMLGGKTATTDKKKKAKKGKKAKEAPAAEEDATA